MPTDLHTALQREREAWMAHVRAAQVGPREMATTLHGITIAQRATDQALAALEKRPTLAEVEAAVRAEYLSGLNPYQTARNEGVQAALTRLRTLYGRGGEK